MLVHRELSGGVPSVRKDRHRCSCGRGHTSQGAPVGDHVDTTTDAVGVPTWDEVVEQHSDRVFRLAYRLTGNRPDAEDLTQEVFVRVFRSLDTYTPGTFEGWLHRITTNLFLDGARRKQRIRFDAALRRARRPARRARRPRPSSAYADRTFDDDIETRARDPAARLPGRRRAVRRRGPHLRGDRRDHGRQARHRALAHPPWSRDAPQGPRAPRARRRVASRYSGPVAAPRPGRGGVMSHLGSRVSALLDGRLRAGGGGALLEPRPRVPRLP